ncbi:hypothetical protein WN944_006987 [Citrus x changshan-huyou]|uniref:Uncharacterized protein n=1 Tax=Citrus x changshan-huyou TaxID=2935761 RepID=A0AAP0MK54_9ROSI
MEQQPQAYVASKYWGSEIMSCTNPLLILSLANGTDDDVVNWFHGNKLWKMARDPLEPLWIKGGGHCNLALYPDYIHRLCWFTQEMKNMNTKI